MCVMNNCKPFLIAFISLISLSCFAQSGGIQPGGVAATLEIEETVGVAKKLTNPISDLVAFPIQYTFNRGLGSNSAGSVQLVTVQPVYPLSRDNGDNFLIRPIVTAQLQNNVNGFTGSGIGNIQIQTFYTPKPTSPFVWGVGPVLITPSGSSGIFGPTQTGAGGSAVGLTQLGPWTAGLLVVQTWAVAGSKNYGTLNNLFYQPFASYTTPSNWIYALDTQSTFNYDVRRTSNQINASITKLITIDNRPISLSIGPQYNVSAIPGGAQGWGARATVTFIFSK